MSLSSTVDLLLTVIVETWVVMDNENYTVNIYNNWPTGTKLYVSWKKICVEVFFECLVANAVEF